MEPGLRCSCALIVVQSVAGAPPGCAAVLPTSPTGPRRPRRRLRVRALKLPPSSPHSSVPPSDQDIKLHARRAPGVAARVSAECVLPLPRRAAFELFAHPDNAAIFRGINRCTYRHVLWASSEAGRADGRQTVEVENESGA